MASDRIGQNEIELTDDALSIMLGVRRAGVRVALRTLPTNGSIAMRRGRIEIRDWPGLHTFAGCDYGSPEKEYERLLARSVYGQWLIPIAPSRPAEMITGQALI